MGIFTIVGVLVIVQVGPGNNVASGLFFESIGGKDNLGSVGLKCSLGALRLGRKKVGNTLRFGNPAGFIIHQRPRTRGVYDSLSVGVQHAVIPGADRAFDAAVPGLQSDLFGH